MPVGEICSHVHVQPGPSPIGCGKASFLVAIRGWYCGWNAAFPSRALQDPPPPAAIPVGGPRRCISSAGAPPAWHVPRQRCTCGLYWHLHTCPCKWGVSESTGQWFSSRGRCEEICTATAHSGSSLVLSIIRIRTVKPSARTAMRSDCQIGKRTPDARIIRIPTPQVQNLAQTKSHLVKLANAIQLNKQNRQRVALMFWKRNTRC